MIYKISEYRRFFFFITALMFFSFIYSGGLEGQNYSMNVKLSWYPLQKEQWYDGRNVIVQSFEGSITQPENSGTLPVYFHRFRLNSTDVSVGNITLTQCVYEPVSHSLTSGLTIDSINDISSVTDSIIPSSSIVIQRKVPFLDVRLVPLRKNPFTGIVERLVSFRINAEVIVNQEGASFKSSLAYASHSVLADGVWIKMAVTKTGICKLSYQDLKQYIDPSGIDPRTIRIYGNGGGMLPEANSKSRIDDLREIPIRVSGEDDGVFNESDYILFYSESPDKWSYSSTDNLFRHSKNLYSDYAYYFLTYGKDSGKRVGQEASSTASVTHYITTFNDYSFYEKDDLNLIKSGKIWYDQNIFELTNTQTYSFSFPDLDVSQPVKIRVDAAGRSTTAYTSMNVSVNSKSVMNLSFSLSGSEYNAIYAQKSTADGSFTSSGPGFDVRLTYNPNNSDAIGYLNYIELNAVRQLKFNGGQLCFRSLTSYGAGKVSQFTLQTSGQQVTIWDVTDPGNIREVETTLNGNKYIFRVKTDSLKEFIAFDGSSFNGISSVSKVDNQDLHGSDPCDYIIVTYPDFISEAQRLADFHYKNDGLSYLITTPEKIYNEFSSGAQDVTAIRDFVRFKYNSAPSGKEPKYLLLLGDASYDLKSRIANNTNYIPTFQSSESLNPSTSFGTDDYFGILDAGEGENAMGDLDIGVGRFPVKSLEEATSAVDKILYYYANNDSVKNDWRNVVCFVADDQDEGGTSFMSQDEQLASIIQSDHQEYNIDKIYLDAYKQVSTPGGARYPEVNVAINQRVTKGALIMNYTGHGGILGWAHERVLELADIKAWTNYDNMPVFVTATCEFSEYDDPSTISAGEYVFLNKKGGGIALFTTARLTYGSNNFELCRNFYSHAFNKTDGRFLRMGELTVLAKAGLATDVNAKKFVLLGDPALTMAYPRYNVVTTSVKNGTGESNDTLQALATVSVSGEIRDDASNLMTGFNGEVFPTVFDKTSTIVTLGNDDGTPFTFNLRKNELYKGNVEVNQGKFNFTFIVPKDIAYQYGNGRISYYARSSQTDANGYDEDIVVGGYDENAGQDIQGPSVKLYINDTNFISGGITNQNPWLLAKVNDISGINTVGNGIGHDITAFLDDDTKNAIILNQYYQSDLNTFTSGYIKYPFFNLSDGEHTVKMKVWDVYDNSTEASISFRVINSSGFSLDHLFTYPNPFRYQTTFSFEYNQPASVVDVQIDIYSMIGKHVRTLHQSLLPGAFRSNSIQWDGTDEGGMKLGSGIYLYTIKTILQDGSITQRSSKLVLSR
ncbi:MAG: type IX secretion system sortase PorU [Bacteroidota bacterium]|nr:type IX secretion system sortase PorU [Bacteroidota bacterium]